MELWQIINQHLWDQREKERLKRTGKPSEAGKYLRVVEKRVTVPDNLHGGQTETTAYFVKKVE